MTIFNPSLSKNYVPRQVAALSASVPVPYYVWGCNDIPATSITNASLSANQVLFQPSVFRRSMYVDQILIQRIVAGTVGATGNVKMAIHRAPSLTDLIPTTQHSVSGVLTSKISTLNPGINTYVYRWTPTTPFLFYEGLCYWFGIVCDVAITNFYAPTHSDLEAILGTVADTSYNGLNNYTALATIVTSGLYTNGFNDPWDNGTYPLIASNYVNFSIYYRVTQIL